MADVKDPKKLTDAIAKQENEDDKSIIERNVVGPLKKAGKRLYENVMGTDEQNAAAAERMKAADKKYPDSLSAKANKVLGYKKGGSVGSASKRADGCAVRGKTKGRMV